MSYLHTILKKLQDHSITPPAEVTDAIYRNIQEEKAEAGLKKEFEQVSELKNRSVTPPAFLLENILREAKPAKVVSFRQYIPRIAAALLVIAAVAVIIRLTGKKDVAKETATIPSTENKSLATDSPAKKDSVIAPVVLPKHSTYLASNTKKKIRSKPDSKTGKAWIDGQDFVVHNNDLFFSFTNFKYNELPSFITSESTEAVKVNLDHSSSITISEGMVGIMKRMYQQKKNGKPTARARRERKKLQRWKDSDVKFFDKHVEKNPMDPLDLAEFIF
ncbi:hypothetical protein [Ferruginibacter sp. HRS2-29]|uniref:hypothetical protein n=1 Tax=Ferruginibacter sp. HRS2-29 TaxID=2487334 RepID=UPI0020CD7D99|nr:hypothetical protein [Ferruginibacter sp. HRS2-29]MCP9750209.1 hypothetical protein [Ferruginibacter sp. HRS2-29]